MRGHIIKVVALLGILAACAVPGASAAAAADDAYVPPTETPPEERAYLAQMLGSYQQKLPYETIVYPKGTTVNGQVTLDFCGAPFPSERLRAGRIQVGIVDTRTSKGVASIESVSYRDVAAADQALAELRAARDACPKREFVESNVANQPPTRWKFAPPPDAKWRDVPGVERVAYDVTTVDPAGTRAHVHLVYLRHGRFLVGLYGPPGKLAVIGTEDAAGEAGLVVALSKALATLPTS